jgi:hypothetical protein
MADFLFDGEATRDALKALAELLALRGVEHQTLILVGGSYLALHNLRESTRDIDSVTRLESATKDAIAEIGERRGYAADWLNDNAAAFRPAGLTTEECNILFDQSALTVLGPSADWIFTMKLYAGRTVDHDDLIRLWPHTGFIRSVEAVERLRSAYPFAPNDPYLEQFIESIRRRAVQFPGNG